VPVVARVFLDHVEIDPAQVEGSVASRLLDQDVEVEARREFARALTGGVERLERLLGRGAIKRVELEVTVVVTGEGQGVSLSCSTMSNQQTSTRAMWRKSPNKVSSDGGTAAVVICSSVSPAHFPTRVAR
jgi:hypothetical protein